MGSDATFGLSRIRQIAQVVHDLPAAVAFYRDKLGMKFLFEVPGQLAFFDCGGIWLMLSPPEKDVDRSGSLIYYAVDDIGAAHRTLTEAGVEFSVQPHLSVDMGTYELLMSFVGDLDRNPFALCSELKK